MKIFVWLISAWQKWQGLQSISTLNETTRDLARDLACTNCIAWMDKEFNIYTGINRESEEACISGVFKLLKVKINFHYWKQSAWYCWKIVGYKLCSVVIFNDTTSTQNIYLYSRQSTAFCGRWWIIFRKHQVCYIHKWCKLFEFKFLNLTTHSQTGDVLHLVKDHILSSCSVCQNTFLDLSM